MSSHHRAAHSVATSAPMMPSPRPMIPSTSSNASQLPSSSLIANKAPQPPVTIDVTTFQQLQQQFHTHQQRGGPQAIPLSAANSASASVTLSQPLAGWPGKTADSQANNLHTLVQSFNRHTSQAPPNFTQSVSFASPSPPPQLHSLVPQPNNHSLTSSPNADRPPSELSYSTVYYPQSPPATALHSLSSGYRQPASPLLSNTYWYDPNGGQQQQYVLKMNNGNLVIPAPITVSAQQSTQLVKQEGPTAIDQPQQQQQQQQQQLQQPIVTPGRHSACAVCHSAKTSCNGQRPCDRCIRLDRQSMCVDRPRKTPVKSDKKKTKSEDGEQTKQVEKGGKKVKREQDSNGTDDTTATKRIKAEESVEEESGKAAAVAKKETASLAPPTIAPTAAATTASTLDSPSVFRREVSSHSSHSSSDSVSSVTPSSPAGPTDELIDVASSTLSSEPERRLSVTYLKMHQVYPTRAAIADAIRNGAVTPLQVHFLLSYLNAVMHNDDFKLLLQPLQSAPASSALVSPTRHLSSLPSELLNERGMYTPRFSFNFGCSPLEPVDDNIVGLIDFATLQIVRVDPTEVNSTQDGTVNMHSAFGLPDSNGRLKAASPSPPAVPFATSSTSAFTAVPSITGSAGSSPVPLPNSSSLLSSSSAATASSPAASVSSPLSPSSLVNTASTAMEDTVSLHGDTNVPNTSSSASSTSSESSSTPSLPPSFSSLSSSASSSSSPPSLPSDDPSSIVPSSTSPSSSSSSTRSTSSPSSSSSSDILFLTVRVNREFERLFGYSQPYMRDLFRSEGGKVLYRLLSAPSMPVLSKWLTEALIGERTEFKAVVNIMNRYKGTTECLLNCRWTLDSGGLFRSVAYCFSPLPEKGSGGSGGGGAAGGGRRMKGDV